jgi:hypothetical protein
MTDTPVYIVSGGMGTSGEQLARRNWPKWSRGPVAAAGRRAPTT